MPNGSSHFLPIIRRAVATITRRLHLMALWTIPVWTTAELKCKKSKYQPHIIKSSIFCKIVKIIKLHDICFNSCISYTFKQAVCWSTDSSPQCRLHNNFEQVTHPPSLDTKTNKTGLTMLLLQYFCAQTSHKKKRLYILYALSRDFMLFSFSCGPNWFFLFFFLWTAVLNETVSLRRFNIVHELYMNTPRI